MYRWCTARSRCRTKSRFQIVEKAICLRMFVIKIIYRNSRHFGCCSQQKSQSPCIHSLHTPGFLRILVAIGVGK